MGDQGEGGRAGGETQAALRKSAMTVLCLLMLRMAPPRCEGKSNEDHSMNGCPSEVLAMYDQTVINILYMVISGES